jgi:hypothetical protein
MDCGSYEPYMRRPPVFIGASWLSRRLTKPGPAATAGTRSNREGLHPKHPSPAAIPRIVESDFSADIQFDSLVVDPAFSVGTS